MIELQSDGHDEIDTKIRWNETKPTLNWDFVEYKKTEKKRNKRKKR